MGSTGAATAMNTGNVAMSAGQPVDITANERTKSIKGRVNSMSAAQLNAYIEEHNLQREYYDRLGSLSWGATSRDRAKVRRDLVALHMTVTENRR